MPCSAWRTVDVDVLPVFVPFPRRSRSRPASPSMGSTTRCSPCRRSFERSVTARSQPIEVLRERTTAVVEGRHRRRGAARSRHHLGANLGCRCGGPDGARTHRRGRALQLVRRVPDALRRLHARFRPGPRRDGLLRERREPALGRSHDALHGRLAAELRDRGARPGLRPRWSWPHSGGAHWAQRRPVRAPRWRARRPLVERRA